MDIISSPFGDVKEFLFQCNQLLELIFAYVGIPDTTLIPFVIIYGIAAVLLLLRGYQVVNVGYLVVTFGLEASYLEFLQRGNGDTNEITLVLVLMAITFALLLMVDEIRFYLVGTLLSVYVFASLIGSLIGRPGAIELLLLGVAVGLAVSSRLNGPLEAAFDDLTSVATAWFGMLLLGLVAIAVAALVFADATINLSVTQTCGMFFVFLAVVLFYTSVQRDHRKQREQKKAAAEAQQADPQPPRKSRVSWKTALVVVNVVLLMLFNGLPELEAVNQYRLFDPINSFVDGFNAYKDKLAVDTLTSREGDNRRVKFDNPITLYHCPSYDCAGNVEVRAGYPLVLFNHAFDSQSSQGEIWFETPYHFQVLFIPGSVVATGNSHPADTTLENGAP